ncbi:hypothetical protein UT300019_24200 [Clostridium sp. CTA-19]
MIYDENEMKSLISNIVENKNIKITPIGNHEIKRNLVYIIHENDKKYVFKMYFNHGKSIRETNSLQILKDSNVKVPKLIKTGNYHGYDWVIMEYISGETLDNVIMKINDENKKLIFKEMGETLGKIHSFKIFDYAVTWDKTITSQEFEDYKFKKLNKNIIEIESQNLPDKDILYKAIKILKGNYNKIINKNEFRFTHNDFEGRNILVENIDGEYKINALIDFEHSYPDNYENDLANLYFKYFIKNKEYEKCFIDGYKSYMNIKEDFYKNIKYFLIAMVIEHCSWSFAKANDYYTENIEFLKKLL